MAGRSVTVRHTHPHGKVRKQALGSPTRLPQTELRLLLFQADALLAPLLGAVREEGLLCRPPMGAAPAAESQVPTPGMACHPHPPLAAAGSEAPAVPCHSGESILSSELCTPWPELPVGLSCFLSFSSRLGPQALKASCANLYLRVCAPRTRHATLHWFLGCKEPVMVVFL